MQFTYKQRVARKSWWCTECQGPIEPGEPHQVSDDTHYGEHTRFCMTCWDRETARCAA
jgi:hypothetical protein